MNSIKPRSDKISFAWYCIFLLPALISPSAEAAERLVAGKWETAMTTDSVTKTFTTCISAEEAATTNGDSKTARAIMEKKTGGGCTINSYEIKSDTVSYSLTCGTRTISDATVFHGETYEGTQIFTNEGKSVTTRLKARRIGAC